MITLQPGDCILYSPVGFFGWVIATKTWHHVAHVEIFDSVPLQTGARSWASRDGIGVNLYPTRVSEIAYVLRPTAPFKLEAAREWARSKVGTVYGWMELLNFIGLPVRNGGMFCSQFAVEFYRAGGWNMFPEDPAEKIAPFEFLELAGAGFDSVYRIDR